MSSGLLNTLARLIVGIVIMVAMPIQCTYWLYLLLVWLNAPLIAIVFNLVGGYIIFTFFWFFVLGLAIEDL